MRNLVYFFRGDDEKSEARSNDNNIQPQLNLIR